MADNPAAEPVAAAIPPRERTTEELARMTRALIAESLTTSQRLSDHVELLREYLHRLGYEEGEQADEQAGGA